MLNAFAASPVIVTTSGNLLNSEKDRAHVTR
jgi:hypothetical protein